MTTTTGAVGREQQQPQKHSLLSPSFDSCTSSESNNNNTDSQVSSSSNDDDGDSVSSESTTSSWESAGDRQSASYINQSIAERENEQNVGRNKCKLPLVVVQSGLAVVVDSCQPNEKSSKEKVLESATQDHDASSLLAVNSVDNSLLGKSSNSIQLQNDYDDNDDDDCDCSETSQDLWTSSRSEEFNSIESTMSLTLTGGETLTLPDPDGHCSTDTDYDSDSCDSEVEVATNEAFSQSWPVVKKKSRHYSSNRTRQSATAIPLDPPSTKELFDRLDNEWHSKSAPEGLDFNRNAKKKKKKKSKNDLKEKKKKKPDGSRSRSRPRAVDDDANGDDSSPLKKRNKSKRRSLSFSRDKTPSPYRSRKARSKSMPTNPERSPKRVSFLEELSYHLYEADNETLPPPENQEEVAKKKKKKRTKKKKKSRKSSPISNDSTDAIKDPTINDSAIKDADIKDTAPLSKPGKDEASVIATNTLVDTGDTAPEQPTTLASTHTQTSSAEALLAKHDDSQQVLQQVPPPSAKMPLQRETKKKVRKDKKRSGPAPKRVQLKSLLGSDINTSDVFDYDIEIEDRKDTRPDEEMGSLLPGDPPQPTTSSPQTNDPSLRSIMKGGADEGITGTKKKHGSSCFLDAYPIVVPVLMAIAFVVGLFGAPFLF